MTRILGGSYIPCLGYVSVVLHNSYTYQAMAILHETLNSRKPQNASHAIVIVSNIWIDISTRTYRHTCIHVSNILIDISTTNIQTYMYTCIIMYACTCNLCWAQYYICFWYWVLAGRPHFLFLKCWRPVNIHTPNNNHTIYVSYNT